MIYNLEVLKEQLFYLHSLCIQDCINNAVFTGRIGCFACACKTGYNGDGRSCSDINKKKCLLTRNFLLLTKVTVQ